MTDRRELRGLFKRPHRHHLRIPLSLLVYTTCQSLPHKGSTPARSCQGTVQGKSSFLRPLVLLWLLILLSWAPNEKLGKLSGVPILCQVFKLGMLCNTFPTAQRGRLCCHILGTNELTEVGQKCGGRAGPVGLNSCLRSPQLWLPSLCKDGGMPCLPRLLSLEIQGAWLTAS